MTAIALKDGVVAVDGLICRGERIMSAEYDKTRVSDFRRFVFAGSIAVYDRLIELYNDPDKVEPGEDIDGCAVVLGSPTAYLFMVTDGVPCKCQFMDGDAEGSGSEYAVAAMRMGSDAVEAVELAAQLDLRTGGKVRAYRVSDGKEIT